MTNNINDVVVSSRIRLARNVDGLPYPMRLNDERATQIARKVYEAVRPLGTFELYKMSSISDLDANVLKEKHLISADLISNGAFGAAIINEAETVCVMINEEDHIREQCIMKGLALKEAYKEINLVDDAISKNIKIAFDGKLGYLTSCPTNLGTGMRASVMMFLPGLTITRTLEPCIAAVGRLNMAIRGVYGEGSNAEGYIYQVSNQKTLGNTEAEIIEAVQTSINHIVDAEFRAREALFNSGESALKDKIYRAYGTLTNAYRMDSKEFMDLVALVKLGVSYELFKVGDMDKIEKLILDAQPANIMTICGRALDGDERDVYRASYAAKVIKNVCQRK